MGNPGSQASSSFRPASFTWADTAVLGIALVWGASYPIAKGALFFAPVLILIFYRFFLTSLVMFVLARKEIAALEIGDRVRGLLLGTILFAIFSAETFGVSRTSATNATLIISLCVVFTPILDYGLSRRLPPLGILFGAVVSCCGVAVLTGGLISFSVGDLLVLGAATLRAIMVVATKRLLRGRSMSSTALTALQALTVAGLAIACVVGRGDFSQLFVDAGLSFWGAVGFLSLFCTIAAFYAQNAAVRHSSPTRVSFLMGFEPLFGCLLAHLLLVEPFSTASIIGAVLIASGTFTGIVSEKGNAQ